VYPSIPSLTLCANACDIAPVAVMATVTTSNRAYLRFLEFIKLIEIENYLRVEDIKTGKNVNDYILVYSDSITENENYITR
jgi:hypothetical protein